MLLRRQLRNFYGSGWFHHNVAVAVFTVLSDAIMPHASERTVPALQSTIYISDSGDDKDELHGKRTSPARLRGTHMKTCPDCNGDGVVDKDTDDERQCPTCGGLGFVPDDDDHEEVIKTSCDLPHGVGGQTMKGILWPRAISAVDKGQVHSP